MFKQGLLVFTAGVNDLVATSSFFAKFVTTSLGRHFRGDWGDLDEEDRKSNDRAVKTGERILSAYKDKNGVKIWIITEADRSATTVLFPSEY